MQIQNGPIDYEKKKDLLQIIERKWKVISAGHLDAPKETAANIMSRNGAFTNVLLFDLPWPVGTPERTT